MEDTTQFVEKFNERKRKDEQNRRRQANGNKAKRLPNKRH
ncbi:DUF4023 domain-containing protein [Ornithinibacillus sp. L9]|uniref:DUF4023 domain-containing protein n=1 Tax=Ornithinibacillus caprae TaxID=2678566 RepID=A0A6N8FMH5_9BACI|nr:DUF4023 family protein [Ornithinibacillus caprae]MUK88538.1 DUF4023 domain-containing protein [Ornithinibacillus caprae]